MRLKRRVPMLTYWTLPRINALLFKNLMFHLLKTFNQGPIDGTRNIHFPRRDSLLEFRRKNFIAIFRIVFFCWSSLEQCMERSPLKDKSFIAAFLSNSPEADSWHHWSPIDQTPVKLSFLILDSEKDSGDHLLKYLGYTPKVRRAHTIPPSLRSPLEHCPNARSSPSANGRNADFAEIHSLK